MINDYLKQIIHLDKTIEIERNVVQKEVEESEEDTKKRIETLEETVLNQTTKTCQSQYDQRIAQSDKQKAEEIKKAQIESEKLLKYYKEHKEAAIQLVLNSLLEAE